MGDTCVARSQTGPVHLARAQTPRPQGADQRGRADPTGQSRQDDLHEGRKSIKKVEAVAERSPPFSVLAPDSKTNVGADQRPPSSLEPACTRALQRNSRKISALVFVPVVMSGTNWNRSSSLRLQLEAKGPAILGWAVPKRFSNSCADSGDDVRQRQRLQSIQFATACVLRPTAESRS